MMESGSTKKCRFQFSVNTAGVCFLCYREAEQRLISATFEEQPAEIIVEGNNNNNNDDATGNLIKTVTKIRIKKESKTHSFKTLCRYVGVNLTSSISVPSKIIPLLRKSDVKINLCSECGSLNERFSKIYQEMEVIRMKMDSCLKDIQVKLVEEEEYPRRVEEYRKKLEGNQMARFHSGMVQKLRKEFTQKCQLKLKKVSPQVKLQRLSPEEISLSLNRSPLQVEAVRSLATAPSSTQINNEVQPAASIPAVFRHPIPLAAATNQNPSHSVELIPILSSTNPFPVQSPAAAPQPSSLKEHLLSVNSSVIVQSVTQPPVPMTSVQVSTPPVSNVVSNNPKSPLNSTHQLLRRLLSSSPSPPQSTSYQCPTCQKKFPTFFSLKKHKEGCNDANKEGQSTSPSCYICHGREGNCTDLCKRAKGLPVNPQTISSSMSNPSSPVARKRPASKNHSELLQLLNKIIKNNGTGTTSTTKATASTTTATATTVSAPIAGPTQPKCARKSTSKIASINKAPPNVSLSSTDFNFKCFLCPLSFITIAELELHQISVHQGLAEAPPQPPELPIQVHHIQRERSQSTSPFSLPRQSSPAQQQHQQQRPRSQPQPQPPPPLQQVEFSQFGSSSVLTISSVSVPPSPWSLTPTTAPQQSNLNSPINLPNSTTTTLHYYPQPQQRQSPVVTESISIGEQETVPLTVPWSNNNNGEPQEPNLQVQQEQGESYSQKDVNFVGEIPQNEIQGHQDNIFNFLDGEEEDFFCQIPVGGGDPFEDVNLLRDFNR